MRALRKRFRPPAPGVTATGAPPVRPVEQLEITPSAWQRLPLACSSGTSTPSRWVTASTPPAGRSREPDILQFADLTGDAHPQHVDPDWAAGTASASSIAHGLLVLSFAVGLLPLDPERVVALRRVGDAVFKQPVKIGDTMHVEGEIDRTEGARRRQRAGREALRILNQDGRPASCARPWSWSGAA